MNLKKIKYRIYKFMIISMIVKEYTKIYIQCCIHAHTELVEESLSEYFFLFPLGDLKHINCNERYNIKYFKAV